MDNGDDNWDLAAIVRSCCCPSSSSSSSSYSKRRYEIAADSPLILLENVDSNSTGATDRFKVQVRREDGFLGFFSEKFETKSRRFEGEGEGEGLEVLYGPSLVRKAAVAGVSNRIERAAAAAVQTTSPRAKRRKKQLKKVVCQVPADGVSPDMWSWRKYGQKPIKGSPFPRGYYRCSTIRGCPARKQVERDRTNPGQLVVTYTSDHNHPMPTNHGYPPTTPSESKVEEKIPTSPATSVSHDNGEQEKEQGEETLMVEDMEVIGEDELIFVGDDSLLGDGGSFSDDRIFASSWFEKGSSSSNATAAAC